MEPVTSLAEPKASACPIPRAEHQASATIFAANRMLSETVSQPIAVHIGDHEGFAAPRLARPVENRQSEEAAKDRHDDPGNEQARGKRQATHTTAR